MTTIVRNMDGCDIEHEALLLQEYGEEVMYAGRNPQLALATAGTAPLKAAFPSAADEEMQGLVLLSSTLFPQCP